VASGDDYGGSTRIPSSCCGVVGLRPSPGRVPQEAPDPAGLNSRGPIARWVADARLLFQVMAAEAPPPPDSRRFRIAVADSNVFGVDPACQAACRRAAEVLEAAGHRLKSTTWDAAPVAEAYRIVRRVSVASFPGDPESFGAGVRTLIREGRAISALDFYLAHQRATAAARHLNSLIENDFDAILTPTLGDLPMTIPQVPTFLGQDWDRYTAFVLPVSFSGLPAVSVPAGLHDGLPVGVQLVGRYRKEWELLQLAEELEQMDGFGFQRPPGFD
jgi:Asp-tRNA(Asn)/Glu-tRNA(Gln) amidotransferase A subunit family amidase